jgi:hypothetical protein
MLVIDTTKGNLRVQAFHLVQKSPYDLPKLDSYD